MLNDLLKRSEQDYVPPSALVFLYFALEENDQGFKWLDKAYEERDPKLIFFGGNPILDPVRSDPRFIDLLKKMNLDK